MKPLKDIRSRDKEMQLAKSDLTLYTRARNVAPVSFFNNSPSNVDAFYDNRISREDTYSSWGEVEDVQVKKNSTGQSGQRPSRINLGTDRADPPSRIPVTYRDRAAVVQHLFQSSSEKTPMTHEESSGPYYAIASKTHETDSVGKLRGSVTGSGRRQDLEELSGRPDALESLQLAGAGKSQARDDEPGQTKTSFLQKSSKTMLLEDRYFSRANRVRGLTAESGRRTIGTTGLSIDYEPETLVGRDTGEVKTEMGTYEMPMSRPYQSRSAEAKINAVSSFSNVEDLEEVEEEEQEVYSSGFGDEEDDFYYSTHRLPTDQMCMLNIESEYPGPIYQSMQSGFDNFKAKAKNYRTLNAIDGTLEELKTPKKPIQLPEKEAIVPSAQRLAYTGMRENENRLKNLKESNLFGWDQALEYAVSERGPISRLNLAKMQILPILQKCRSKNHYLSRGEGLEGECMDQFSRVCKKIVVKKIDGAINAGMWLRALVTETENNHWPIWVRIIFLSETGGLAKGVMNVIRDQVKTSFQSPDEFLLDYAQAPYDPIHDKGDDRYWLCIWVETLCWLFKEFYLPVNDDALLREFEKMFREDIKFDDDMDKVEAIAQVHYELKLIFELARQVVSGLCAIPQLVVNTLIDILRTEKGLVGELVGRAISRYIRKVAEDPYQFLVAGSRYMVPSAELAKIKSKGNAALTMDHYFIITSRLIEIAKGGREQIFAIESYSDIERYSKTPRVTIDFGSDESDLELASSSDSEY